MSEIVFDDHQQRLIDWREGKAICAASAGSGKTTVAIERLACMPARDRARSLTLLYNKAAQQDFEARLKVRVGSAIPPVYTFHAFGLWCLKEILSNDPEWKKMKLSDGGTAMRHGLNALKVCGIDAPDVKPWMGISANIRERMIDTTNKREAVETATKLFNNGVLARQAVAFTEAYQNIKMNNNVYDFTDMLTGAVMLLDQSEPLQEWLSSRFDHVQIDEAQDCSMARWRLMQHAARKAKSVVATGDLRQSCYSFAAADINILINAYRSGEFRLLTMPVNRRSTRKIVDIGNNVCAGRSWHLGGDAKPKPDAVDGADVNIILTSDEISEAVAVADEIVLIRESLGDREKGDLKSRFAVLSRTNGGLVFVDSILRKRKIPVKIRGTSGGVWAGREGQDFLAYLRAAEGEADESLCNISNKPVRFLKRTVVQEALAYVHRTGDSIIEALFNVGGRDGRAASKLATDLKMLGSMNWQTRCQAIASFLSKDARERDEDNMPVEADEDKAQVYVGLSLAAQELGGLPEILKSMEDAAKLERFADVELSTIHRYKGAEAETVFLIQARTDHMPHKKATDLEEERRLFFIAVSRAKTQLYISSGGTPSKFLRELKLVSQEVIAAAEDAEAEAEDAEVDEDYDYDRPLEIMKRDAVKKATQERNFASGKAAFNGSVKVRKKSMQELEREADILLGAVASLQAGKCPSCGGEGRVKVFGSSVQCISCSGSGKPKNRR